MKPKHLKGDVDRVLLYLYIIAKGEPSWAKGGGQLDAVAFLTGWSKARARRALEQAWKDGFAMREQVIERN